MKSEIQEAAFFILLGIIIGFIGFCNTSKISYKNENNIHDSIYLMQKPKVIIDTVLIPISTGKSIIKEKFSTILLHDTIYRDSCCIKYLLCSYNYDSLYNYSDSIIKPRYYPHHIEDNLISIDVNDSTLGTLDYRYISYKIKPVRPKESLLSPTSLYLNLGYDVTTKNVLIGSDYVLNKFIVGYIGNVKDQNSIKIGYKIK